MYNFASGYGFTNSTYFVIIASLFLWKHKGFGRKNYFMYNKLAEHTSSSVTSFLRVN